MLVQGAFVFWWGVWEKKSERAGGRKEVRERIYDLCADSPDFQMDAPRQEQ